MRKLFLSVAIMSFVLSSSVQPALAGEPLRVPLRTVHDVFAAGVVCPFAIAVDSVTQNETATIFMNGRILITGALTETITNLATNRSVVVNASGPVKITGDSVVTVMAEGRGVFALFASDAGPSAPALLLTTGLVVVTIDGATGRITSFVQSGGTIENLCQTLA